MNGILVPDLPGLLRENITVENHILRMEGEVVRLGTYCNSLIKVEELAVWDHNCFSI